MCHNLILIHYKRVHCKKWNTAERFIYLVIYSKQENFHEFKSYHTNWNISSIFVSFLDFYLTISKNIIFFKNQKPQLLEWNITVLEHF